MEEIFSKFAFDLINEMDINIVPNYKKGTLNFVLSQEAQKRKRESEISGEVSENNKKKLKSTKECDPIAQLTNKMNNLMDTPSTKLKRKRKKLLRYPQFSVPIKKDDLESTKKETSTAEEFRLKFPWLVQNPFEKYTSKKKITVPVKGDSLCFEDGWCAEEDWPSEGEVFEEHSKQNKSAKNEKKCLKRKKAKRKKESTIKKAKGKKDPTIKKAKGKRGSTIKKTKGIKGSTIKKAKGKKDSTIKQTKEKCSKRKKTKRKNGSRRKKASKQKKFSEEKEHCQEKEPSEGIEFFDKTAFWPWYHGGKFACKESSFIYRPNLSMPDDHVLSDPEIYDFSETKAAIGELVHETDIDMNKK